MNEASIDFQKLYTFEIEALSSERNPYPAENQTLRSHRVYISPAFMRQLTVDNKIYVFMTDLHYGMNNQGSNIEQ